MPQFGSMPAPFDTPSSPATGTGLLPQLYPHAIGPEHSAYYQRQFQRFETLERTPPSWNSAAAASTLGWGLLRGLWRHAAMHSAAMAVVVLAWLLGLHGRVPVYLEISTLVLGLLALGLVPGFLGNAWYYNQVHAQTLQALAEAPNVAQAQEMLQQHAPTPRKKHIAIGAQAGWYALLVMLALVVLWPSQTPQPTSEPQSESAPAPAPVVQAPVLNFPPSAALVEEVIEEVPPTPAAPVTDDAATLPALPITQAPSAEIATAAAAATAAAIPTAPQPKAAAVTSPPPPVAEALAPPAAAKPKVVKTPKTTPPAAKKQKAAAKPVTKTTAKTTAKAAPKTTKKTHAKTGAKANTPANAKAAPALPAVDPVNPKTLEGGRYYVTAGTYAKPENAQSVEARIRKAGLPVVRHVSTTNKGTLTRLRSGPFASQQEAEAAQRKLQQQKIPTSIFRQPS